jgi:hypothetical protein
MKPHLAACRELPNQVSLPRPGFPRFVVLLVPSVLAINSDVFLLVANEALALLLKSVDLLLSEESNLAKLPRFLIGRAMRVFLRLNVDLLRCLRKVAILFDNVQPACRALGCLNLGLRCLRSQDSLNRLV